MMNEITTPKTKVGRRVKRKAKGRMSNFLMFLPNMVMLLGRLLKDARVPPAEKALFLAAIVYVISPLDFIPDIFPFIGQVDDIYVVALTLLRLVNRTDESVVRQHWSGGGDIVSLADSIARIAPMVLPKRIARLLSSKVELAPAGKVLRGIAKKDQAIVVEIPQTETESKIKVDSRSSMTN
ncbi:MAG: YkvA family protein [Blastocatellia bacterium]